ncbi:Broad specificity phosphatase PhoE [Pseudomonas cedrina]|uniref:Broad specificity phosphatase PhoE n=1 Tax=Pseudomonas cedrina TaxID=651740 RepID=A0ABY0UCB6_PSECE|nr:Broad specificity phosphatase PhoE [Pseudomonas cedrina]
MLQSTRLTLICHAVTPQQKKGSFPDDESVAMDWRNAGLSLAGRYRNPRLLCGPEARTRQTAGMFSRNPVVENALRDGDFGRWKGKDLNEVDRDELADWIGNSASTAHGGESVDQVCARVGRWLKSLETHPGHVVAVTHPFVIRAAMLYVMQFPISMFYLIDVEPLSATELRFNQVWRLRLQTHAQAPEHGKIHAPH